MGVTVRVEISLVGKRIKAVRIEICTIQSKTDLIRYLDFYPATLVHKNMPKQSELIPVTVDQGLTTLKTPEVERRLENIAAILNKIFSRENLKSDPFLLRCIRENRGGIAIDRLRRAGYFGDMEVKESEIFDAVSSKCNELQIYAVPSKYYIIRRKD
nr:expressed protein [Hymenolepis microstoma]